MSQVLLFWFFLTKFYLNKIRFIDIKITIDMRNFIILTAKQFRFKLNSRDSLNWAKDSASVVNSN